MIIHMEKRDIDAARDNLEAALLLQALGERIDFDTERVQDVGGRVWTEPQDHLVRFDVDCLTPITYAPGV